MIRLIMTIRERFCLILAEEMQKPARKQGRRRQVDVYALPHGRASACRLNSLKYPEVMPLLYTLRLDDLTGPEIAGLLQEHLDEMHQHSPPESVHALDLDALRRPDIAFWTVWADEKLAGCGALKELDPTHGEIKSMRTSYEFRGKGAGKFVLRHILDEAGRRGYKRLSLETGSMAAFDPARRLYESHGFEYCGPFADYILDPNSVFMTIEL